MCSSFGKVIPAVFSMPLAIRFCGKLLINAFKYNQLYSFSDKSPGRIGPVHLGRCGDEFVSVDDVVSSLSMWLISVSVLVLGGVVVGKLTADKWASTMAVATDKLNDSAKPTMGNVNVTSTNCRIVSLIPLSSLPMTMQMGKSSSSTLVFGFASAVEGWCGWNDNDDDDDDQLIERISTACGFTSDA